MFGWGHIWQDGYYASSLGAWPWYSVGQTSEATRAMAAETRRLVRPIPTRVPAAQPGYDPTVDPNWRGARALVRSTIQSVLGVDAIFDQIYRQIVQHLVRQGFLDRGTAAAASRPDYIAKVRAWVRRALYYADVDTIIDLVSRQLVQYARAHGDGPFG